MALVTRAHSRSDAELGAIGATTMDGSNANESRRTDIEELLSRQLHHYLVDSASSARTRGDFSLSDIVEPWDEFTQQESIGG